MYYYFISNYKIDLLQLHTDIEQNYISVIKN